ncbi:MAG: hypothetical protein H6564_11750 [Lewinellaceae bacterium]|nr:hypothetical protein [Lewinellaceae bacterium]
MKKQFWFLAVFFAGALAFTACEKNDTEAISDTDEAVITGEDETAAANLFQDTEDEVDYEIETRDPNDDCPTITVTPDDGSFPRTITIDYGTDGCLGLHGRVRKGVVIVTLTDSLNNPGAVRTVTFDNFFVDDAQIQGVKALTNEGYNSAGLPTFSRSVEGASITFPNGDVTSWQASHTVVVIGGSDTPQITDNVIEVSGGSSGVNRHGVAFTVEITTPLVKSKNCPWVESGVKAITTNSRTRMLDYGDGECDRVATLTFANGFSRDILIRRWW